MYSVVLIIAFVSLSAGTTLESAEDDNKAMHLPGTAFGYEILEHRLDGLQNTILQLFTSMEKAEQTRLESQRATMKEVQDGNKVFLQLFKSLEKAEQTRLESQRAMLEQVQNGIKVKSVNSVIEDCTQAEVSGRYLLRPIGYSQMFTVLCEAESFEGGWIVIQQRIDGNVNFYHNWESYKIGFGSIGKSNEFWIGLEKLHQLTKYNSYELAVELKDESGRYGHALYSGFQVAGEDDHYRLSKRFSHSNGLSGIGVSNDEKFSTFDKDNDKSNDNCGSKYGSGWWFYKCEFVNLNGPYKKDPETGRGIFWRDFTNAATYSRVMIRRA